MLYKSVLFTLLIANSVVASPVAMNEEELDGSSASFYGGSPEEIQENVDKGKGSSVEQLNNQSINTVPVPDTTGIFIGTEAETRLHQLRQNIDPATYFQGLNR